MLIKDMFEKNIDRDIQGVIKVGQDDDSNIRQELEEYVVTRELQKHFRDFFSNYKKGIAENTDKMGVWMSGFFGSGKSHFLKILSYLLENREVEGKKALDYFLDDKKIVDEMVLADMKLACNTPTDVVLFNIDSKSKSAGTKGKDSILNVFLRVFNEMQGFSTDPHLADLERQLADDGLYEDFKRRYEELHKLNWLDNRHKFKFHRDKVIKTLADLNIMSQESAREWTSTTTQSYEISIDRFAQLVKEYLDKKEDNHHIVFLVDEIGQYIGDNTDLMLNLQTITEDLGTICHGKAWIIVTSQQDIDSITEVSGRDFSKIQGRFDTRLNLTSANVDEIIKLRILEKNQIASQTLSILYENKETIIKNLLLFNDGIEKKLYSDRKDFVQVYPFIPYQFNLLGSVLTSIRQHGASGKHLSEGERSMLALFKESAEKIMNQEDGHIVAFHVFYDGLDKFLDHSHSAVISRALDNGVINPQKEDDNFTVNVLKTLFLIKYVKEIEANLDNITTLMVSNINDDRISLKERVEEALRVLIGQTLVQKNGDIYIFLTDEEQEVNREIERQHIESQALTKKIAEIIYTGILTDDKIRHKKFGNLYNFDFNKLVDEDPYRFNQTNELGLDIITPMSEKNGIESNLRMSSQRENKVYVDLPNDGGFIEEIRTEMKIAKYIQMSTTSNIAKIEDIKNIKRSEMKEHHNRGILFLQESLNEADFYLNGDKLDLKSNNFKYNVGECLEALIDLVYHKLNYIEKPMDDGEIKKLFKDNTSSSIMLEGLEESNKNALNDVLEFIKLRTQNHNKISLKEIKDRFSKAPYGFIDKDIEWLLSKLFVDGQLSLSIHGESISLVNKSDDEIINYITRKQYVDKLLIEEKEVIDPRHVRSLKDISKSLYNIDIIYEDTDLIAKEFNRLAELMIEEINGLLENYKSGDYPGAKTLADGIDLLNSTRQISSPKVMFKMVFNREDDYLEFEEDYHPIKSFFKGEQREIWEKSQHFLSIYQDSRTFILNENIERLVAIMEEIIKLVSPYRRIKDLPELNDNFLSLYGDILDQELKPVLETIQEAETRVMTELEETKLEDKFGSDFKNKFDHLKTRAEDSQNVAQINGFTIEADTLKMRCLKDIERELDRINQTRPAGPVAGGQVPEEEPLSQPVTRTRNIRIKDINPSNSWRVESKEDIDSYLAELRAKIERELEENTVLNIEF